MESHGIYVENNEVKIEAYPVNLNNDLKSYPSLNIIEN
jgi:hypothetical protein